MTVWDGGGWHSVYGQVAFLQLDTRGRESKSFLFFHQQTARAQSSDDLMEGITSKTKSSRHRIPIWSSVTSARSCELQLFVSTLRKPLSHPKGFFFSPPFGSSTPCLGRHLSARIMSGSPLQYPLGQLLWILLHGHSNLNLIRVRACIAGHIRCCSQCCVHVHSYPMVCATRSVLFLILITFLGQTMICLGGV